MGWRYRKKHLRLGAAALTGVIIVGCVTTYFLWLPNPRFANKDQLMRWLVLRDVSAYSHEIQIELVDRVQDEILQGTLKPSNFEAKLPESYIERLKRNAEALQEVWFFHRIAQYKSMPKAERMAFLRRQVDAVLSWANIRADAVRALDASDDTSDDVLTQFLEQVDQWVNDASQDEKPNAEKGVQDSLICWLATRDLNEVTLTARQLVAEKIASRLSDKPYQPSDLKLDDQQQSKFDGNVIHLFEAWYYKRADEVSALAEVKRTAYVDKMIKNVMRWDILGLLNKNAATPQTQNNGPLAKLDAVVTKWIQAAPANEKKKLIELHERVSARLSWTNRIIPKGLFKWSK